MRRAIHRAIAVTALVFVAACGSAGCGASLCTDVSALGESEGRIVAVGDSILAWNGDRCESIPDHAALAIKSKITNAAVSGARFLGGAHSIPSQLPAGTFDVVIVDGGGNDLNGTCACGECDGVLDALISADGRSGAMATFVDRVVSNGSRVIVAGYYPIHDGAWYGFDRCKRVLGILHERQIALATAHAGVVFFDFSQFVTPSSTPDAYGVDNVHPTDEGSTLLGEHLGARIASDK